MADYDVVATVNINRNSVKKEERIYEDTTGTVVRLAGIRLFHALRDSLKESAELFELLAEFECPKNTSQLSKTIGHYKVDADTRYDAILEYGYAEDPSVAIFEEEYPRPADPTTGLKDITFWVGTSTSYAAKVNERDPFMQRAAIRVASGISTIITSAIKKRRRVRARSGT